VETTVEEPETAPSSARRDGITEDDSWTKWSCDPSGMSESSVGEVLINARVERVLEEWGGVGGRCRR
jgi:hypothetical protein